MSTCAWLATHLDFTMLRKRGRIRLIQEPGKDLEVRSGEQVAEELGGRLLLRYVTEDQVHEAKEGREGIATYVTPTAYAPGDLRHQLALPAPTRVRGYVVAIDPAKVEAIVGPRFAEMAPGIEYVLPDGYPPEAVVGPDWAVEVT